MLKFPSDYNLFYRQLTGRIRESGAACFLLRAAGKIATGVMYAAYPLLLIRYAIDESGRELLAAVLIPGIGFILLTAVRARINRPRPYETWEIDPLIHKDTKGNSMPSRHVFSSAVISMAWLPVSAAAGIFFLILSAAAALIRVLGGVHYPSDVIAGFAAGVICGIPLLFI
jgi:membrane-associated phospholipid phosphatase